MRTVRLLLVTAIGAVLLSVSASAQTGSCLGILQENGVSGEACIDGITEQECSDICEGGCDWDTSTCAQRGTWQGGCISSEDEVQYCVLLAIDPNGVTAQEVCDDPILFDGIWLGDGSICPQDPTVPKPGRGCRQVRSNIKSISNIMVDPDCNGYEFCQYLDVRGTINGKWWGFWDSDDEDMVFGALVFSLDDIFETNQGEIYAEERGIAYLDAPDGYAANMAVIGGSSKYHGVTGWMTAMVFFDPVGGKLMGEVCWNGD